MDLNQIEWKKVMWALAVLIFITIPITLITREPSNQSNVVHTSENRQTTSPEKKEMAVDEFLIKKELYACTDKDLYTQISRMKAQGDKVAFGTALGYGLDSGECTILKVGMTVFVQDTEIFSGLINARPQGILQSYWVQIEAIKD